MLPHVKVYFVSKRIVTLKRLVCFNEINKMMRNGHGHIHNVCMVKYLTLEITLLAALGSPPASINCDTIFV